MEKHKGAEPVQLGCATIRKLIESQVAKIHQQSGHPGMKRTLYFARSADPSVSTTVTKSVIKSCEGCQSTDPAPERKGESEKQLGLVSDGYHSEYAIWQPFRRQNSTSIINQLISIFFLSAVHQPKS